MYDQNQAKLKLEEAIQRGTAQAAGAVQRVLATVPTDSVVKAAALTFRHDADKREAGIILGTDGDVEWSLHPNARRQVEARANIPGTYADKLAEGEPWQRDLLCHALRETYAHGNGHRHLVRAVDVEAAADVAEAA